MTLTRSTRTVTMGTEAGDASDIGDGWYISGAADAVEAIHGEWPTNGTLVATAPGGRIHLLGFPDSERGYPATAGTPSIPAVPPELPDIEGPLTQTGSNVTEGAVAWDDTEVADRDTSMFMAIEMTIPADPSGCVFEIGDDTDGAYIGFVSGDLVIRNGTGADLRVDATPYEGQTGTLFVHFDVSDGSVTAWWGEDQTLQCVYLGFDVSSAGDWWGPASTSGNGELGGASGTSNIDDGSVGTPAFRDAKQKSTNASSTSANVATHAVGDALYVCVTMHPNGQDGAADVSLSGSGWSRILDHDGASGSYAPAVFLYRKIATSPSTSITVTASGPTAGWEKTITVLAYENDAGALVALGDVQNAGPSDIDFPDPGSSELYVRMYTPSISKTLTTPSGDSLLVENDPYSRAQRWTTGAAASVSGHSVATDAGHTSLSVGIQGAVAGEGNSDFNGTIVSARFYSNQLPANIMDEGTPAQDEIPAVPGDPIQPYIPGTSGSVFSEITAGRYLEAIRARLVQSRTGAGLWTARLFARDPDGLIQYATPVAAPTDISADGTDQDRYLSKVTALGDGTSWDDAAENGWDFGILLETISGDESAAFGTAELDIAELELTFAHPPAPTVVYPAGGSVLTSVTPAIGWTVPAEDTQSGYRVRVWEADTYSAAEPNGGRIAYDSGRRISASVRSHQITRPLRPDVEYMIGLKLEGGSSNGRRLETAWITTAITTPVDPTELTDDAVNIDELIVTPQPDGTALITAANSDIIGGSWAMIERARVSELEALAADPDVDDRYSGRVMMSTALEAAGGFQSIDYDMTIDLPTDTLVIEWHGAIFGTAPVTVAMVGVEKGPRMRMDSNGRLSIAVHDATSAAVVDSVLVSSSLYADEIVPRLGDPIGIRMSYDWSTEILTVEISDDDGESWETVDTVSDTLDPYSPGESGSTYVLFGSGGGRSNPSYFRRVLMTGTGDQMERTTILDLDVDRDLTETVNENGLTIPALVDPIHGSVIADFVHSDVLETGDSPVDEFGVWEIVSIGTGPRARRAITGAKNSVAVADGRSGASTNGVSQPMEESTSWGRTDTKTMWEWFGYLAEIPESGSYKKIAGFSNDTLDTAYMAYYRSGSLYRARMVMDVVDVNGSMHAYTPSGVLDKYIGRRVGIRMFIDLEDDSYCRMYVSENDGDTWIDLGDITVSYVTDVTQGNVPLQKPKYIDISESNASTSARRNLSQTERFRVIDQTGDRSTVWVDVDLGRDIDDPAAVEKSRTFVDRLGLQWFMNVAANLVERPTRRTIPAAEADDVWTPIAGLREIMASPPNSTGDPLISHIDPAPPLNEPLVYRARIITEVGGASFETESTDWVRSPDVTVTSDSWWISTLDNALRHRLDPTGYQVSNDRPNTVAAGPGRRLHRVSRDVQKGAFMNVDFVTLTRDEWADLSAILNPGGAIFVCGVHGEVWLMQPIDQMDRDPITAIAEPGETAPVAPYHAHSMRLVEIEDPRDLGFGVVT